VQAKGHSLFQVESTVFLSPNNVLTRVSPLLSLLEWAERQNLDLPADLSEKHDEYLWEKPEQEK